MRSPLIALTIASALVFAACSSDDDTSTSTDAVEPTATTEQVVESTTPDTTPTTDAPVDTEAPLEPFEVLPPGPYDVGVKTITINADQ